MKIYISGAITGTDDYMARFERAEQKLRARGETEIINPAKVCSSLPGTLTHEEYMKICLAMLSLCDEVYLIPPWTDSRGVRQELEFAIDNNKHVEVEQ